MWVDGVAVLHMTSLGATIAAASLLVGVTVYFLTARRRVSGKRALIYSLVALTEGESLLLALALGVQVAIAIPSWIVAAVVLNLTIHRSRFAN